MNIQVDPTSSNLASAMLNSKIRPRAVVGYGIKIFHPSPPNYVTRSPGGMSDFNGQVGKRIEGYEYVHGGNGIGREKYGRKDVQ